MTIRLVLFTAFVASSGLCTASAEDLMQLSAGRQETRELKTGDTHVYTLSAQPGQFVLGEALQRGVDVAVTVTGPDGSAVGRFDGPARGPEYFQFETGKTGLYRISVAPFEKEQGEYTVRILRQEPLAETPAGKVDQLMSPYRADGPGGVVAVVRNGEIEFAAGYGLANVEYGVPNTRSTPYHMASVSKQFTALAVVLLSLEGKLGLDDDVRKVLPEMPDLGRTVTLRHLLNHTSGIRDHWTLWAMSGGRMDDVIRQQDLMRLVTRQRDLNFEPGAEYLYSNAGYLLLSEVVTRVSGRPFGEWMRANVFEPLGMRSTQVYDDHERLVPGRAYSYQYSKNGLSKAVLSYANSGATSLFTTAEDLARWLRNFRTGQVGGTRAIELLQVRGVLNDGKAIDYALGVGIGEQNGLRRISHGGADAGFRTWLGYFPEIDAGVVVLGNVASFDAGGIGARVAETFFAGAMHPKEPAPAEAKAGEKPMLRVAKWEPGAEALAAYTGRYYSAELETFYTVSLEGKNLVIGHRRHGDFGLNPEAKDVFACGEWFIGKVKFGRDQDGRVGSMLLSNGRVRALRFERVERVGRGGEATP
jgi:CubicO group peptidase (beta-lactamase class C family)